MIKTNPADEKWKKKYFWYRKDMRRKGRYIAITLYQQRCGIIKLEKKIIRIYFDYIGKKKLVNGWATLLYWLRKIRTTSQKIWMMKLEEKKNYAVHSIRMMLRDSMCEGCWDMAEWMKGNIETKWYFVDLSTESDHNQWIHVDKDSFN